MPKKKRSLIGYVRPKKRAISEEEEALEEPSIANDVEPIPEEVAPMPPEASLSAMSIADGDSNDAPPQESKKSMLRMLKADYHKTLRNAAVVHRRWCKTGLKLTSTLSMVAPAGRPTASGSASSTGCRRPTTSAVTPSGSTSTPTARS